jgi:hypothetical protein
MKGNYIVIFSRKRPVGIALSPVSVLMTMRSGNVHHACHALLTRLQAHMQLRLLISDRHGSGRLLIPDRCGDGVDTGRRPCGKETLRSDLPARSLPDHPLGGVDGKLLGIAQWERGRRGRNNERGGADTVE